MFLVPQERIVMIREHMNYWYSLRAYYFAKTLADTPFQIVFPLLYCVIVYFTTAQKDDPFCFVLFVTFCILVSLVTQSCGLLIGATTTVEVSVFLGPITSIPILLFSGFFVTFDSIPFYLKPLSYLSYVRYGFEGILLTIYSFDRAQLQCSKPDPATQCVFKDPELILSEANIEDGILWVDVVILLVFVVVFRAICYCVLRYQVRSNK